VVLPAASTWKLTWKSWRQVGPPSRSSMAPQRSIRPCSTARCGICPEASQAELNPLVGKRFRLGSAVLEGMEPCDPCASLGQRLATAAVSAPSIVRALAHRGGLRARVVEGGEVAPGDELLPD